MKNGLKFWSLVVIASLIAGFTSCEKDEKKKELSIEGKWQLDKDAPANATVKECELDPKNYREFIKGGEYKELNFCNEADPIVTGTWKKRGNKLTVKVGGIEETSTFIVTEDELTISATALGTTITKTYKRIN